MQVILAESAGFCYGVKRAVELAQKTAEETQGCWMLGDLIHNTHVDDLAARGVRKTDRPETLAAGDTVVIRSHGSRRTEKRTGRIGPRGVRCVNATCPNVVHIQNWCPRRSRRDGRWSSSGAAPSGGHGIASWCVHPLVFQGPEAVAEWVKNGDFQPEMPCEHPWRRPPVFVNFLKVPAKSKKECTNVKNL